jgi:hypothetical protein
MGSIDNMMLGILAAWGAVTAVLICMVIYRSTLSSREEDQIFLCAGEEFMAAQQRALVARIERLGRPISALMIVSGALLATLAGVALWQVFKQF